MSIGASGHGDWCLLRYLYSFLCLFIYVVLNIFITIIEDSYFRYSRNPAVVASHGMTDSCGAGMPLSFPAMTPVTETACEIVYVG